MGGLRPKNLHKIDTDELNKAYPKGILDNDLHEAGMHAGFEEGVDETLEALKKSGITMSNHNPINRTVTETASFLNQCENGWLVFIPDEE